jgi:hypothetical protein
MLAERGALSAPAQAEDLGFLEGRRQITGEAANAALTGELTQGRTDEIAATIAVCERVLRRRAVLG